MAKGNCKVLPAARLLNCFLVFASRLSTRLPPSTSFTSLGFRKFCSSVSVHITREAYINKSLNVKVCHLWEPSIPASYRCPMLRDKLFYNQRVEVISRAAGSDMEHYIAWFLQAPSSLAPIG